MTYKLIYSPKIEEDIDKAISWYSNIDKELARQFIAELEAAISFISKNPAKVQIRYQNTRIAFLKIFPYGVHFILDDQTISVLAVFNMSENSDKWPRK